ncbi:protein of unknown function [Candidatus Methylomirabilis oxygeniifera]|uniref:Uncharacterized protein n=1 Tax=Methylomirabilis oxygeniifera TaxID=671143 RepID=D5MEX3_METO1|nr:protein of unknown function [Candidatus Methylomirabilis oxyfera]
MNARRSNIYNVATLKVIVVFPARMSRKKRDERGSRLILPHAGSPDPVRPCRTPSHGLSRRLP